MTDSTTTNLCLGSRSGAVLLFDGGCAYLFACFAVLALVGTTAQATAQQRALIALDGVKVFSLPMVDDSPLTVLVKGDTVRVIGQRSKWVKIEFAPGKKGWMQVQLPDRERQRARSQKRRTASQGRAGQMSRQPELHAATNGHRGAAAAKGTSRRGVPASGGRAPDEIRPATSYQSEGSTYRRFGYAFGMGVLETDFTYNWKFVFHQTPRLALEGSFKHALGQAADSYLIMANFLYLLQQRKSWLPYLTGGMGVINTVPERSIDTGSVSHMAVNYGVGARKFVRQNLSLLVNASVYTVFVGKGVRHFKEVTIGLLVGKFWD
ncbi:MAG: SH3 domain-containing protein [bacterium]